MHRKTRAAPTVLGLILAAATAAPAAAAEEAVSFRLDVFPIIETRCVACHSEGGEGYEASGLDLTTYDSLMRGTKHGPIVIAGDPLTSNFNVLIEGRASPELRMPHGQRPLLRYQRLIIRDWVKQGAENN